MKIFMNPLHRRAKEEGTKFDIVMTSSKSEANKVNHCTY